MQPTKIPMTDIPAIPNFAQYGQGKSQRQYQNRGHRGNAHHSKVSDDILPVVSADTQARGNVLYKTNHADNKNRAAFLQQRQQVFKMCLLAIFLGNGGEFSGMVRMRSIPIAVNGIAIIPTRRLQPTASVPTFAIAVGNRTLNTMAPAIVKILP